MDLKQKIFNLVDQFTTTFQSECYFIVQFTVNCQLITVNLKRSQQLQLSYGLLPPTNSIPANFTR